MIELGGNITLVGFKEFHHTELVVVKKMVGNYVRKFATVDQVNELRIHLKPIHKTEDEPHKYELKATLDLNGKIMNAELIDFNIYVGLDELLKKLETQVEHKKH